jgi:hypothetical protein
MFDLRVLRNNASQPIEGENALSLLPAFCTNASADRSAPCAHGNVGFRILGQPSLTSGSMLLDVLLIVGCSTIIQTHTASAVYHHTDSNVAPQAGLSSEICLQAFG